jgi:hypothetical protein
MTLRDRMLRLLENIVPSGGMLGGDPFGYAVGETDKRPMQYPDMKRRRARDPLSFIKKRPRRGRAKWGGQPGGPTRASRPWAYHGESLAERMVSFQRGKRGDFTKSGPFTHYPFVGLPKSREMLLTHLRKLRNQAPKVAPKGHLPIPKDGTAR